MGKVILNHLIGNNCPEFRNGLLGSYFFKLTCRVNLDFIWIFVSGQSFLKSSGLSSITKILALFKPELLTQFDAYAVVKFNP